MARHLPIVAPAAAAGRLRREYLGQGEGEGPAPHRMALPSAPGDAFTLGGHRLSSLYRDAEAGALTLTSGYRPPSSWQKYSMAPSAEPGRPMEAVR